MYARAHAYAFTHVYFGVLVLLRLPGGGRASQLGRFARGDQVRARAWDPAVPLDVQPRAHHRER
eukprot:5593986-Pleurochrysis_carterae.AAC.2